MESLESEQEDLFKAGKFSAAIRPCGAILTIRGGLQPAGHWEVRTAREQLRSCERLAAMPPAQQEKMRIAWDAFSQGPREIKKDNLTRPRPYSKGPRYLSRGSWRRRFLYAMIDHELGIALYRQASYDKAAAVFRRELTGYRGLFGEKHPNTALAHETLAVCLISWGTTTVRRAWKNGP